ncbi:uncharacterized protein LOC135698934 [Ochlerotatus camptorhynchus]|uniref:uncharacterized protein LOC135698934 n=1 Tax=Ochlerotatus camptorhynchus TaxID=644619 RepID=UPI0031CF17C8
MTEQQATDLSTADDYVCGENPGAHGNIYQRDLAFVLFVRGTLMNYKFKLATEMTVAGKFDDVIVYVKDLGETWLVQAKHAILDGLNPRKISHQELFPTDDRLKGKDFDLFKYMKSYFRVKRDVKGKKRCFIFTNKDLEESTGLRKWAQMVPGNVNDMMDFSKFGGSYRTFKLEGGKVSHILVIMNQELNKIKLALVELFQCGQVERVLTDFKTPLAEVLTVKDGVLRFTEGFLSTDSDLKKVLLESNPSIRELRRDADQAIRELLDGRNSRNRDFPALMTEGDVNEFFESLTLCLNQPNELRKIVDCDLRLWLKDWVRPDELGKFGDSQLMLTGTKFDVVFKSWDEPSMTGVVGRRERKPFLCSSEGAKCFDEATKELQQSTTKIPEVLRRYYVNREIVYDRAGVLSTISDTNMAKQLTRDFGQDKCLILIAEPGMGKTTVLQYMSFESQKQSSTVPTYLIYLNGLKDKLQETGDCTNLDSVLGILEEVLSRQSCSIIQETARAKHDHMQILFFLDGFDEVPSSQNAKVIEICRQLLTMERVRIIISGRRHVRDVLVTSLEAVITSLVPLKSGEQMDFLKKFWNVQSFQDFAMPKFQKYASLLLEKFHKNIKRSEYDFTGLPLMVRLLAEIYTDHFERFMQTDDTDDSDLAVFESGTFSVVVLFEQFVRKSFCMKMLKKFNLNAYSKHDPFDDELEPVFRQTVFEHQLAAIKELNISELQGDLTEHSKAYEVFMKRIEDGKEKSLLINVSGVRVQFLHLSFGEYFIARYLYDNANRSEQHLLPILEKREVVRRFFLMFVEENLDASSEPFKILDNICNANQIVAFWASEAVCEGMVQNLLTNNDFRSTRFEQYGSLLHVSASVGSEKLTDVLIHKHGMEVNCLSNEDTNPFDEFSGDSSTFQEQLEITSQLTPLHLATSHGHKNVAELLLAYSADVNARNTRLLTPLHLAAQRGFVDIGQMLIDHQADVNAQDEYKRTSLHLAARFGHMSIVVQLTTHAADLNAQDYAGITPLHLAIANGHVEIVKHLIVDGLVDVTLPNKAGTAPLHVAAESGQTVTVQLLLNRQVDAGVKNYSGYTPLHLAAQKGHADIVRLLVERASADANALAGTETPLSLAASAGCTEIVRYFINHLAEVNSLDKHVAKAFWVAVQSGHTDIFKLLLNQSADVNAKQETLEITPLHIAASHGFIDIVEVLLDHSAEVDARDMDDATPLMLASDQGHNEVVKLLLKRSAKPNAQKSNKWTSLHFACYRNHQEVVGALLDGMADVDARNEEEWTPLHWAARYAHLEIAELLLDRSASINVQQKDKDTPLHLAIRYDQTMEVVRLLVKRSADLNIRNKKLRTPLHMAAHFDRKGIVNILINAENLNSQDSNGCTPLHLAVEKGADEVVKALIHHTANVLIQQAKDKWTPLHLAARHGRSEIAKLLIDASADAIEARDKDNSTALHLAARYGHVDTVRLLIDHSADVTARQINGKTPLDLATKYRCKSVISVLNGQSRILAA